MKVTNIYLQDTDQTIEIGGASSGLGGKINAEIYALWNKQEGTSSLYIICDKGAIQEGDTALFGRYITGRNRPKIGGSRGTLGRYRGWIIPYANKTIGLSLTYIGELNGKDKWEVKPNGYDSFVDYEANRGQQEISLRRKCGITIFRGEEKISNWLKFKVAGKLDTGYFLSRW